MRYPNQRDGDGAPLVRTHDQGNPPWCYRCGVEWMFIGYESGGGPFGGGHLLRPRCDCWRLGTPEAVAAILEPRPAFKSRHTFPLSEGTGYGPCRWCNQLPDTAVDPVFCMVGPPATPADKPSSTPPDTRATPGPDGRERQGVEPPRVSLTVPCPSVVDDPSTSDAEVADALAAARRDMMMLEDFEPADLAHVMAWAVTRLRARPRAPETRTEGEA